MLLVLLFNQFHDSSYLLPLLRFSEFFCVNVVYKPLCKPWKIFKEAPRNSLVQTLRNRRWGTLNLTLWRRNRYHFSDRLSNFASNITGYLRQRMIPSENLIFEAQLQDIALSNIFRKYFAWIGGTGHKFRPFWIHHPIKFNQKPIMMSLSFFIVLKVCTKTVRVVIII